MYTTHHCCSGSCMQLLQTHSSPYGYSDLYKTQVVVTPTKRPNVAYKDILLFHPCLLPLNKAYRILPPPSLWSHLPPCSLFICRCVGLKVFCCCSIICVHHTPSHCRSLALAVSSFWNALLPLIVLSAPTCPSDQPNLLSRPPWGSQIPLTKGLIAPCIFTFSMSTFIWLFD